LAGIVVNEVFEGDGGVLFKHACRLRRHRLEAAWLALPLGPFSKLGEGQKSESTGSQARGRGGLGFATLDQKPQADGSYSRGILKPEATRLKTYIETSSALRIRPM
jgi:hypothetical protein